MITADGSMGLLATGVLDDSVLRSLLEAMPDGTWELVCHPGYSDRALDAGTDAIAGVARGGTQRFARGHS